MFDFAALYYNYSPNACNSALHVFLGDSSLATVMLPLSVLSYGLHGFEGHVCGYFVYCAVHRSSVSKASGETSQGSRGVMFLHNVAGFFFVYGQ